VTRDTPYAQLNSDLLSSTRRRFSLGFSHWSE
jgi:hypothetical protein